MDFHVITAAAVAHTTATTGTGSGLKTTYQ